MATTQITPEVEAKWREMSLEFDSAHFNCFRAPETAKAFLLGKLGIDFTPDEVKRMHDIMIDACL